MPLDYATLVKMRLSNPAWRLLCADMAPLVASFLEQAFIEENVRYISQADLEEKLDDQLYRLRETLGDQHAFPKSASEYLNDWCANDKGWLRKFYRQGSDEPFYDLTPSTEKAIGWLNSLSERTFVGTESRLLTLFSLLREIVGGSESNPALRIADLRKRRDELDSEIHRIERGDFELLNDTALRDRFQQCTMMARELLSDFREVENNFRRLDRRAREKIMQWDGTKGALLQEIMGERDNISSSDQGKSFQAFWDFLMSASRQEELSRLLERVLAMPPILELQPDPRIKHIHYDWLEAGEHTQRTVAQLSQQLRRFLDDAAFLEDRKIIQTLRNIESKALDLRETTLPNELIEISYPSADIELPMERPLFTPKIKPRISSKLKVGEEEEIDVAALFSQTSVDMRVLIAFIRNELQTRSQVNLCELLDKRPLEQGLAELIAYMQLATDTFETVIDELIEETVTWQQEDGFIKQAIIPRIIFVR